MPLPVPEPCSLPRCRSASVDRGRWGHGLTTVIARSRTAGGRGRAAGCTRISDQMIKCYHRGVSDRAESVCSTAGSMQWHLIWQQRDGGSTRPCEESVKTHANNVPKCTRRLASGGSKPVPPTHPATHRRRHANSARPTRDRGAQYRYTTRNNNSHTDASHELLLPAAAADGADVATTTGTATASAVAP